MKRKTLAIPIRLTDFSNSSQVAALFSRDAGLLELIVKGAYRPKNSFQGPLDLAVLREVVYVERRSSGLGILAESEVLDGYRGLRTSWERHAAASCVIELVRAVAVAGEPAHDLFDLTAETLCDLAVSPAGEVAPRLLRFELRALKALGFLGAIDSCVSCHRAWPGRDRGAYFSARNGGLLCRRCRSSRASGGYVSIIPGRVVEGLKMLSEGPRFRPRLLEKAVLGSLHRLLFESCSFHLERPLRVLQCSREWF